MVNICLAKQYCCMHRVDAQQAKTSVYQKMLTYVDIFATVYKHGGSV